MQLACHAYLHAPLSLKTIAVKMIASANGADTTDMDGCRWDASYEQCQLDKVPHTCLTKPCKALEYCFEGQGTGRGRGRDNIVQLEVVADGILNAVAFWFDLHLDSEISLCSGERQVCCMCPALHLVQAHSESFTCPLCFCCHAGYAHT